MSAPIIKHYVIQGGRLLSNHNTIDEATTAAVTASRSGTEADVLQLVKTVVAKTTVTVSGIDGSVQTL